MAVDEKARRQLRTRLLDTIGPEATDTLMEELGALGRDQLATRHDVQLGFAKVERDMTELRSDLKTDMAELRTDMAELRTELKTDMAELRTEFKTDMAELRTDMAELRTDVGEIRTTVAERLEQQTRQMLFGLIGSMATISGIAFGAARLS